MAQTVHPFLMFQGGVGNDAIAFYQATFRDCEIVQMDKFGPGEPGPEGTIKLAAFRIAGHDIMVHDSFVSHGFGFTPSLSLFVECESDEEIERLAAALSDGGQILMPMGAYGWSTKFTWVSDRFGVSWQLNLI